MESAYTLYIIGVVFSLVISIFLAIYSFFHRKTHSSIALGLIMTGATCWSLGIALAFIGRNNPEVILWGYRFALIGSAVVPVFWLLLILPYCGYDRFLRKWYIVSLSVIPVVSILLACLSDLTSVFYFIEPNNSSYYFPYKVSYNSWFWIHAIYSYIITLFGIVVAVKFSFSTISLYRKQASSFIVAALLPLCAAAPSAFFGSQLSYAPFGLVISGISFSLSIFRFKFFDLVPIARDKLIESMNDGMVVLDNDFRIVFYNAVVTTIIGENYEKYLGRHVDSISEKLNFNIHRLMVGDIKNSVIKFNTDKTKYYDVYISDLKNERQQNNGILILLQDITQRKIAEDALVQTNEELRKQNEELDTFARTVAHDLKSPLNIITGYSDLLIERMTENDRRELLELVDPIKKTGFRIARIVNEILLLVGIQQQKVVPQPVNMRKVIGDVLDGLEQFTTDNNALIIVHDGWPEAVGYAPWIEEIWANYISNAIKYGGKPPRVELGSTTINENLVKFWVKDNGGGLSKDQQEKVFHAFTRLDETKVTGHGLGLSIVKRIMDKLDGEIGIDSSVGEGCVFYFILPKNNNSE